MGNSAIPMSLNDDIRILLFPKLLVVLITIVINEFGRFFKLLRFDNTIKSHFILRRPFKNILFQRFSIGKLFLIFRERIKPLNLDFRLFIDFRYSLLATMRFACTGVTHDFKIARPVIIMTFYLVDYKLYISYFIC
jgi:hypothetical protein